MKGLLRATAVAFLLAGLVASAASSSVMSKATNHMTESIILADGPSPVPEWPPSGPNKPAQPDASRR
jgi:hypothetical protein